MVGCWVWLRAAAAGGEGFAGGDGGVAAAALGAEGELVVVEAAGQFGFLEMCGDVFVGHFVEASLDEVGFLNAGQPIFTLMVGWDF